MTVKNRGFGMVAFFRFFIVLFFLSGCKLEGKNIEISIGGVDYSIPEEVLSYHDDFHGGDQETLTLNVLVKKVDFPLKSDGNLEEAMFKTLIYSKKSVPSERRESILRNFSKYLRKAKGDFGEEVISVSISPYEYHYFENDKMPLIVKCIKSEDTKNVPCIAYSSRKAGSATFSFNVGKLMLSNIFLIDEIISNKINGFRRN